MLELNVITLNMTSMPFGRQMKERRRGAILNVGSTAGAALSRVVSQKCLPTLIRNANARSCG